MSTEGRAESPEERPLLDDGATPRAVRRLRPATDPSSVTISPRYGRRDYLLRRTLASADALTIVLALGLAFFLSPVVPARSAVSDVLWVIPTLPFWILLFRAYSLYERDVKRINHGALDDVPSLFHAVLVGTIGFWLYFRFVAEPGRLVAFEVAVFAAAVLILIPLMRALARRSTGRIMGPERVVFLGDAEATPGLERKIRAHPEYGLEPIGVVPLRASGTTKLALPVLATLGDLDLFELVKKHSVERLIVAHEQVDDPMLMDLLQQSGRLSIKVSVLPRYIDALGPSVQVDDIEGVTILDLNPLVLPRSSRAFKRLLDIVGSLVALILAAPLMLVIAAAIRLDSRGPVLFRQERIGRRGRPFQLLKFRTMVVGAEDQTSTLLEQSTDPHWLRLDHDPRITRVGRVLRSMSLDELPQFANVFIGQMSLVGPRPLLQYQDDRLSGWARTRLDLAPGITGLWQVLGRTTIPFAEMVKLDTLYVTNWSLWLDIKLLLRTIGIVITRKGAT